MTKTASTRSPASGAHTGLLQRLHAFDGTEAVVAILLWKLGTFITAYIAWYLLPFDLSTYSVNYRYGALEPDSFWDGFVTWDSQHYIKIAEQGYEAVSLTNAFGPLFPLLIRAGNLITGDSVVSGLLIANVASGLALFLLYRLVTKRWSKETAFGTLLLCMAFPTAFFLNLIYTEALFLLLILVVFWGLMERRLWWVAIAAFFLPMLRVPGLVALVPIAWVLGGEALRLRFEGLRPRFEGIRWNRDLLCLLAPFAGFAAYLVYMHIATGNAFIAMDTEQLYISDRGLHNLLRPDHLVTDFFRSDLSVHGYLDSALDRVFFAVFVLSLPLVFARVPMPMFLFCAIVGLQPFLGSFMSYSRLVMVAFPLYIAYAATFTPRWPHLTYALAYPLLLMQALLLSLHINSSWVA